MLAAEVTIRCFSKKPEDVMHFLLRINLSIVACILYYYIYNDCLLTITIFFIFRFHNEI